MIRMTDLFNTVIKKGKIPEELSKSWMVSKGKVDALECNSCRLLYRLSNRLYYRGKKLLEHIMKLFQRVIEVRLREMMDTDDM